MAVPLSLADIPVVLHPELQAHWQIFLSHAPDLLPLLQANDALWHSLPKVWACSPFVAKGCAQNPSVFRHLLESGDLLRAYADAHALQQQLAEITAETDEAEAMRRLRLLRQREMLRIAWRDLAGWAALPESLRDLSQLAEVAIQQGVKHQSQALTARFGQPCNAKGEVQPLLVLGMGKLGGRELNFSSDIDLIFLYPERGVTQGGRKSIENQEYFTRLGQKIIHVLNSVTADGFVFRVDMRLRPFGDSGPLAIHFDALEDYYQSHAREWERYACIKARALTGTPAQQQELTARLRPFVFRRYLDFSAVAALRDLKTQIDQEILRKGNEHNIKLGQGGIREIEFIAQAIQLLRGGRLPALQTKHLLETLQRIGDYQLLPASVLAELREAYVFLRNTEHRIQSIEDRQTQLLPDDELNRTRLFYAMGFASWNAFFTQLEQHRVRVQQHFARVIAGESKTETTAALKAQISHLQPLQQLWTQVLPAAERDDAVALEILQQAGFEQPAAVWQELCRLHESSALRQRTRQAQERLDALMPLLLLFMQQLPENQAIALHRSVQLIEAVAKRSVYLSLLMEHPQALKELLNICANSAWIAEQIIRYPLLLDELLEQRHLYNILNPEEIDSAIRAQLAHIPEEDLEMQMDSLRHFKRAQVLHVALGELRGKLTVEVSSDYLTAIADSLLRQALQIAWHQLSEKHGRPLCRDNAKDTDHQRQAGFCIIGYGKAGGIEMSHSSDLDLVFLHNSSGAEQLTDGIKPIDNTVFFSRMVSRIIHLLSTSTAAGVLYEVDPRLRPGGKSGLLVSSLTAYRDYQLHEAWTWEHQALVRARAIAGDPVCMSAFEQIRREILSQVRDLAQLRTDVLDMRQKMRDNLDQSNDQQFDLKQGKGGIADIEFIVQFGVLRWAHSHPTLLHTTGMLPMLKRFADNGLFAPEACQQLSDAYRTYRTEVHRLALQNQKALVPPERFALPQTQVQQWWEKLLESVSQHTDA